MKKIVKFASILMTVLACFSCKDTDPIEPDVPEVPDEEFKIEIYDLHSSYCKVRVTPSDPQKSYFCGVATESYLETFGSLDDMLTTAANFIETEIIMNQDLSIADLMKKGTYERDVTGLQPEQRFIVFACYTDKTGAIVSEEVSVVIETAPAVSASVNTFEIEIDQITATSAMLFITPSNDDDYVWMELPEDIYADMSMEELEAFLLKNYKPFFPLHTQSGEMVHSFDDKLDPDTEYMVIVFGYDGGLTTSLTTKTFRTLEPNDPTNVTFSFEYTNLTSRSVEMTFIPSDNSVSYLAIVVDEGELEKNGGATPEGVKKLIDKEIKTSILFGDCDNRAEFARYNAHHGKQTGNFSVVAGKKHYACAVCVDAEGEYASEVSMAEFVAPSGVETDASATAEFDKYFDGDALAAFNPSLYDYYAGTAVLPIRFYLEGSAFDAFYSIYSVDVLEKEGADEAEILELMLNPAFIGEYTFQIEEEVIVQLDWDCAYRLFILPYDINDNIGKLVSIEIPALSRKGASPASEF